MSNNVTGNKDKEHSLFLSEETEQGALIESQQKTLSELSEHSLQLQKLLEEKDACIVSQQKVISGLSDWSNKLNKELGDTREYFNQVWREYSSMRNKFHQLRINRLVGWFVNRDRYLLPGERKLRKLAHKQPLSNLDDDSEHQQFMQIGNETGTYHGLPHTVILDVTAQCNLQCVMCFQSVMKKKNFVFGELTDKSISNTAQFIVKANELKLFATGEPFLSSGLRGIIDVLHGNVPKIIVSTNGTIYNDDVDYVIRRLTTLTISIDSASKENFEKIRKNSKFTHIIKNIKQIRNHHPNLFMTFAVTVAKYNLDECPEIIQLAAELKINHVQFSKMRSLEPGMQEEELHEADREWIKRIGLLVDKASRHTRVTVEWQI